MPAIRQAIVKTVMPAFAVIEAPAAAERLLWPEFGWPGRTVIIPCLSPFATSHQLIGYARMNPAMRAIDTTNQNPNASGFALPSIRGGEKTHGHDHARHQK